MPITSTLPREVNNRRSLEPDFQISQSTGLGIIHVGEQTRRCTAKPKVKSATLQPQFSKRGFSTEVPEASKEVG
jgi:hypothetical protein